MGFINQREHFRVEIMVPVSWQILSEEEVRLVKKGLGATLFSTKGLPSPIDELLEQAKPGSEDEQLYLSLNYINNKLDFIIDHLLPGSSERLPTHDNVIDISASGLKFYTHENLDVGTLIKMNLILPGTFQYQMDFITEVVRAEKDDDGFIVAAKIIYIDENDLDSIVKVIFQKQRLDIRADRGEKGE